MLIFIGPQASGKSTITKVIYFFRSLKNDFESIVKAGSENPVEVFKNRICEKLQEIFKFQFNQNFNLRFEYSPKISISIHKENESTNVSLSPKFKLEFIRVFKDFKASNGQYLEAIQQGLDELFSDSRELLFVPAGRSQLATLSIHNKKFDPLTKSFIPFVKDVRNCFVGPDDLVENWKKNRKKKPNKELLEFAADRAKGILKASGFRNKKQMDLLYFQPEKYILLNDASSGQQETIWILHTIYMILLDEKKIFMVLEEPEAHLYPESQKRIIDLICLLANQGNNQVAITTHSPYILSSINNLLYAHQVGQKEPEKTNDVVDKKLWLDPKRLQAFFVDNGGLENIVDKETKLIKTEAIDSASRIINEEFDQLFDLDN